MSRASDGVRTIPVVDDSVSWDGTPLPRYPEGTPRITILRTVIPPYTRLEMHSHPVINAGMVLRGELTVVTESGQSKSFRAGDAIVEVVGPLHCGINQGEEEVELVMFYAGAEGLPLSVKSE